MEAWGGIEEGQQEVPGDCGLVTTCTVAHQAPLSMESPSKEYWSGLSLPSPGIKPRSPALQANSLLSEPLGKSLPFLPLSK